MVGVPAWLVLAQHVPLLQQMPGVVVMAAMVAAAITLSTGPALLAVAIGAIGHEIIRTAPVPPLVHVQRAIVVAIVGGACVALSHVRAVRLLAAQRYQALFERHPLPMFVFDEETMKFLSVNAATVRTYGYSARELLGMTLRDIRPAEELPALEARPWAHQNDLALTTRHRTKAGQVIDVLVRSQAVPFQGRRARLVLVENITETRALEAQLRQAQKMEAIGQLAGGIAHDFNNLLTAIRGYASLLLDSLPAGDARREDALEIERAVERAATLTRQLLAFSRKQIFQERVFTPNDIVTELAPMLRRIVGENIRVRTVLKSTGLVKSDPSQLEQVILNLVVNARDAIASGGEITIETADVEIDELYARTHPAARVGPHVLLAVCDTGEGMPPDVQARAFEPFFTTKPVGQGTGLGLSTVYGIVKQSGGHVWIYSEVGRGTTCKVYLPRTDADPDERLTTAVELVVAPAASASILIVEDEDSVRGLLQKVLARAGYTVHAAANPDEVVALLGSGTLRLDLLITDVILSQQSGRDVADTVRQAQPGCRVLYISGYTDDAVVRQGILSEQMPFLQKPFSAAALLEKVRTSLASPL